MSACSERVALGTATEIALCLRQQLLYMYMYNIVLDDIHVHVHVQVPSLTTCAHTSACSLMAEHVSVSDLMFIFSLPVCTLHKYTHMPEFFFFATCLFKMTICDSTWWLKLFCI